ncbi:MAG: hypothetical protein ACFE8J_19165, partial [Candidatus Heimdallarchaeota archaeon]
MKALKKISAIIIFSLILISIFNINAIGTTTIGNSTFPVEEGNRIKWKSVNASDWYDEVDFVQTRITDIYNDTYESKLCMMVNYTLEFYHKFNWVPQYTNSFYMAYNFTLNFLNWSEEGYKYGNLFIFPTPVNLTLIGNAIEREGFFNYTVDDNVLTLNDGNLTTVELAINTTTGISEVIEKVYNSTTMYRWELNRDTITIIVPYGNYSLIFTTLGIIAIIL